MAHDEALSVAIPNVLRDPLITIDPTPDAQRLSLAGLLAQLLAGPNDVHSFPNVTPVQRSYWYRFLVRCGARALRTLDLDTGDVSAMEVDELTRAITLALGKASSGEEAWLLYQPDADQPAFLQPPTPDGTPPEASYRRNSMSLLTSAIGAKMHERKVDVDRILGPEQTVYALIEYQTGVVFGGRGNYGSQLMGSASGAGSGSPFMGVRLGTGYRDTFVHDVNVFLSQWDDTRTRLRIAGDTWALWTERWDGESQLPAERLDPAFIPLARLIRLGQPATDGRFDTVWFKPTKCARVDDHSDGGLFGDIFTPLVPLPRQPGGWKVRGTLKSGYDYPEIVRLLFGIEAIPSASVAALADPRHPSRSGARVVFEGTSFEQGKTSGFFYREVPLPSMNVLAFLADPEPVQVAHEPMLQMARAAKSAIRGASRIILAGTPKPRDGDGDKVERAAHALEHEIDRVYIPTLLAAAERQAQGDEGYLEEWGQALTELTRDIFRSAIRALPSSGARRYEREIYATSWLDYRLRIMRGEETSATPVTA